MMIGETLRPETSLQAMFEAGERRLRLWQVGANLIIQNEKQVAA
jgi:hypothetical protein